MTNVNTCTYLLIWVETASFLVSYMLFINPFPYLEKKNKITSCWCQHSAAGCLVEDKKFKWKKGHNSVKYMHFELSPLIVWIALWMVNTNFSLK